MTLSRVLWHRFKLTAAKYLYIYIFYIHHWIETALWFTHRSDFILTRCSFSALLFFILFRFGACMYTRPPARPLLFSTLTVYLFVDVVFFPSWSCHRNIWIKPASTCACVCDPLQTTNISKIFRKFFHKKSRRHKTTEVPTTMDANSRQQQQQQPPPQLNGQMMLKYTNVVKGKKKQL